MNKLLQWGHVFSDVETKTPAERRRMPLGFNGATSFQTWKPGGAPVGSGE